MANEKRGRGRPKKDTRPQWYINKLERDKEYIKESMKRLELKFNQNVAEDVEMYDYLSALDNKTAYIKALIQADMNKRKGDLDG